MYTRRDPKSTHAHTVSAESHQRQDHQSGQERSRQALEHSQQVHEHATLGDQDARREHGPTTRLHEDLALLAYTHWEARGRPLGSPDYDWFCAVQELGASEPTAPTRG